LLDGVKIHQFNEWRKRDRDVCDAFKKLNNNLLSPLVEQRSLLSEKSVICRDRGRRGDGHKVWNRAARRIGTQLFAHAGISLKKAGDATRTPQQKQSDQRGLQINIPILITPEMIYRAAHTT
jgi:hypothetical protein